MDREGCPTGWHEMVIDDMMMEKFDVSDRFYDECGGADVLAGLV